MKCETVRDLIPMYIDDTASEETRELVAEHLDGCEPCAKYCRACRKAEDKTSAVSRKSFEKAMKDIGADISQLDQQYAYLSKKLKMRKLRNMLISVFVLLGMAVYVTIDIVNTVKRKEKK